MCHTLEPVGLDFEDEHWKLWEEEFAFNDWVKAVERACAPSYHRQ